MPDERPLECSVSKLLPMTRFDYKPCKRIRHQGTQRSPPDMSEAVAAVATGLRLKRNCEDSFKRAFQIGTQIFVIDSNSG